MPFGWGGSILGGGTAGPSGDFMRDRAGDPGEYHHSRNLRKNMAVGKRRRRESKTSRGEESRSFRIRERILLCVLLGVGGAVRLACRCAYYIRSKDNVLC